MAFHRGSNIKTTGLVLYLDVGNKKSYKSETEILDISKQRNVGTITGASYSKTKGGVLNFDGIDDFIGLNPISITSTSTISITANFNSVSSLQYLIGGTDTGISYDGTQFICNCGGTIDGVSWSPVNDIVQLTIRRKNDGTYDLFIDNNLIGSGVCGTNTVNWNYVGKISTGSFFNGSISLIRIYSRVIDGTEIYQTFQAFRYRARPAFDINVESYLNKAGILNDGTLYNQGTAQERTGSQLWEIMDTYTLGLKSKNLWDEIGYDYPIIGGDATKHSISLKTPDSYIIDWFGGWIHDGLGATPNGMNTKTRTYYIPYDHQSELSNGITIVVGTNNTQVYGDGGEIGCMIGAQFNSTAQFIGVSLDNNLFFNRFNGPDQRFTNTDARGLYTVTRTNNTTKTFRNNVLRSTKTNASGILAAGVDVGIGNCMIGTGGQVDNNGWSVQRMQGAIGHTGLTDQQSLDLQELLDKRETDLGRKTW